MQVTIQSKQEEQGQFLFIRRHLMYLMTRNTLRTCFR
ncbi:UNVERIFIED_CONTAM: hypothetical protein GTU68_046881 [Idotea baltica]|nr:hypothetical protein [Idotea baltica]